MLLARLADPETKEPLRRDGSRFFARADGAAYPVDDGIGVLHVARRTK